MSTWIQEKRSHEVGTKKPLIPAPHSKFQRLHNFAVHKNVIEGTVNRVFRSTSKWEEFDQALEKNRKQWIENHYPKNWSDRVVFETLNKIIEGGKI